MRISNLKGSRTLGFYRAGLPVERTCFRDGEEVRDVTCVAQVKAAWSRLRHARKVGGIVALQKHFPFTLNKELQRRCCLLLG